MSNGKVTSRREFLKVTVLGAAATSLLAACAPAAAPTPTTAPAKPAETPKPAAPPTTAPAQATPTPAAKPTEQAKPTAAPAAAAPTATTKPETTRKMRQPNPATIPKASSGGLPQIELVVASMAGPDANAHVRNAPRFTEYTKGKVKVRVEDVGRDAWASKLTTTMQSQSSAWDVVVSSGGLFLRGASSGWYVPMDQLMKNPELFNDQHYKLSDFVKPGLDAVTWEGKIFGLGQHLSAQMLHYRADLLQKYGVQPPDAVEGWTFDQLADACRKVKKGLAADGKSDIWPMIFLMKTSNANVTITYENITRSMGGKVYDERGIPTYNIPEGKAAIELVKSWMDEGLVSPGSLGYEYTDALELERQGKVVMAGEWDTAAVELNDPEKSPITAKTLQYTVYPYDPKFGAKHPRLYPSVWINSVSSFSKQREAAFAYCVWYTSPEIAYDYLMYGGGHSGRSSLLSDPEVLEAHRQYKAMLANFQGLAPFPPLAQYDYLARTIMPAHLSAFFTGQKSAQKALDDAQKESMDYLKSQGVKL